MRTIGLLLLCIYLAGCTTLNPTRYDQTIDTNTVHGKKIIALNDSEKLEEGSMAALFIGNKWSYTKNARAYSRLAAMEYCSERGLNADLLTTINQTKTRSYTEVNSYTTTTPGYSKFNGKTYRDKSKDTTRVNTYSTPVTEVYPMYSTLFKCRENMSMLASLPKVKDVPAEMVNVFTKDFRGGFQVQKVSEVPAKEQRSNLKVGDVILSIDGTRVSNWYKYRGLVSDLPAGKPVTLEIIRNKKIMKIKEGVTNETLPLIYLNALEAKQACRLDDIDAKKTRSEPSAFCTQIAKGKAVVPIREKPSDLDSKKESLGTGEGTEI